jgi:3-oxoacyl-[acyl-carrier protein] reductase
MTRTVIVTGASRGIGEAIAKEFYKCNDNVAMLARNKEELDKAKERIATELSEGKLKTYECDVRDKEQVLKVFGKIDRDFGGIDVLVNNAGSNSRQNLNAEKPFLLDRWLLDFGKRLEGFKADLDTNLVGTYICSYVAAGYMMNRGKTGVIINISSVKGIESTTNPGYGAAKAGIIKLAKDFAASKLNIRVECIAPGFIDTGMTSELPDDKKEAYRKKIPEGRFGGVEDVAKVVRFFASDEASYINGQTLNVDGGYLMI